MRNLKRPWVWGAIAALLLTTLAFAGDKKYKNKYANIEVVRFDIKEGVNFPVDYLHTMTEELVGQLQQTGKFAEVLREGETPQKADVATLRLVGTVIEFQPGSRAKRYLVGFGAGKTKVVAHVKFLDKTTGEVLFERNVDGKVVMGGVGGESIGATRGLAKEVAKVSKQEFF